MKDLMKVAKKIKQFCPYDWAERESLNRLVEIIGYWLKEDAMWKDIKYNQDFYCQTGGFSFKITKSGRRYIETIPVRIYID